MQPIDDLQGVLFVEFLGVQGTDAVDCVAICLDCNQPAELGNTHHDYLDGSSGAPGCGKLHTRLLISEGCISGVIANIIRHRPDLPYLGLGRRDRTSGSMVWWLTKAA